MKKITQTLTAIISISLFICSVAIIGATAYLFKYKNCSVDECLLHISNNTTETQFYCYPYEHRTIGHNQAQLIRDASLNSGIKYKFIPYNEMPEHLINAFIAIEDKRFYKHNGVDIIRSGHATINYLFGKGDFGGSTITQQLIKNLTGRSESTPQRKIKEAFEAIDLEKKYTKSQILEMYLNIINLSSGCQGIGAAAEYYFSKKPNELSLAECASIAAITNNPTKYDPIKHIENNKYRRDLILKSMLELGYISETQFANATSEAIILHSSKTNELKINSWYIDTVIDDVITDLSTKLNIDSQSAARLLYRGGFKIYTAMDIDIQNTLEDYYRNVYNFPIAGDGSTPQSSMIVIDPYTGDILGVVGSVGNKKGNRIQNYATHTKRPTGSTIKPLSVYAPAIDMGLIEWSTVIEDSPISEINGNPWPKNANGVYCGKVNIKYAIENSLNTVAIKVLTSLGNEKSFDFLTQKLNITGIDKKSDMGAASLALGQQSQGISLKELTSAYTIFEDGIMKKPRSYYKVTDMNDIVILDNASYNRRAISSESAAIMTKLMQTVIESGTAKQGITLNKITEVAGKSGTTQNNCDRYFIGYTPDLLAGVWMGYEYPKPLDEFGGNVSVYIWDDVMNRIYDNVSFKKQTVFSMPKSVQQKSFNKLSGQIPTPSDPIDQIENGWFKVP